MVDEPTRTSSVLPESNTFKVYAPFLRACLSFSAPDQRCGWDPWSLSLHCWGITCREPPWKGRAEKGIFTGATRWRHKNRIYLSRCISFRRSFPYGIISAITTQRAEVQAKTGIYMQQYGRSGGVAMYHWTRLYSAAWTLVYSVGCRRITDIRSRGPWGMPVTGGLPMMWCEPFCTEWSIRLKTRELRGHVSELHGRRYAYQWWLQMKEGWKFSIGGQVCWGSWSVPEESTGCKKDYTGQNLSSGISPEPSRFLAAGC